MRQVPGWRRWRAWAVFRRLHLRVTTRRCRGLGRGSTKGYTRLGDETEVGFYGRPRRASEEICDGLGRQAGRQAGAVAILIPRLKLALCLPIKRGFVLQRTQGMS